MREEKTGVETVKEHLQQRWLVEYGEHEARNAGGEINTRIWEEDGKERHIDAAIISSVPISDYSQQSIHAYLHQPEFI